MELKNDSLHSSRIELNCDNLRANADFIRGMIGEQCRLSFVIKGNAYGHGIEKMVPMAEQVGIRHFSVFSSDEAARALAVKTGESRIMIMGYIADEMLTWAIENGISFYITSIDRLRATAEAVNHTDGTANVHLELETGFHRTGLKKTDIAEVADILSKTGGRIKVEGTATHYAGAESIANYYRIQKQIVKYNELCNHMILSGIDPGIRHTACSAATLTYPETVMDMVRVGIALYGFWPTSETKMNFLLNYSTKEDGEELSMAPSPLKRVMSWKTEVMSLHTVGPGKFVGYGNSCLTSIRSRFAAIPIGYSHGFSRDLSNCGYVLIRGKRAYVSGVVNMNMLMVDVTEIPDVQREDEVVIIGHQENSEITVSSFSALSQYLNYEVLVQIPSEIPRIQIDLSTGDTNNVSKE